VLIHSKAILAWVEEHAPARELGGVRYEQPPLLPHDEASRVLAAALRGGGAAGPDAASVLVGLALSDDDRAFVEAWCVRLAREAPDLELRAVACLCIGTHLARRFGEVSDEALAVVHERAAAGDSQALDAAEDLEIFLRDRRRA
jgi:hypothetical protein